MWSKTCCSIQEFLFLQIHVVVNFDLDIFTATTNFFFQTNSKAQWALGLRISISTAISSFSDLHDQFCDACGEAGLVKECVKLLRSLKIGTDDFSDVWVSPSMTERMQMTSRPPCLCTQQNSEIVLTTMNVGKIITNPGGVFYTLSRSF